VTLMEPPVTRSADAPSEQDDAMLEALSALLYPADGEARESAALRISKALGPNYAALFQPQLAARLLRAGLSADEASGTDEARRIEHVMQSVQVIASWWPSEKARVQSPGDLAAILMPVIGRREQEELHVAAVDGRNGLVAMRRVYAGTATGTSVRIAELLRPVLDAGGVGFALAHNHPSGDPEPSEEDLRLTAEVVAAARLLDLEFLDHLVVGHGRWVSIRSQRPLIWSATEISD